MTDPAPSDPVVTWTAEGPAFVVRLANPPANQLGQSLLGGLSAALAAFDTTAARILVVCSGLDGFFAAGADIKPMADADRATLRAYGDSMRAVLDRIAALDRPSIAAIEGRALGGGLELALACTLRIGSASARLGLPEAKLGLIPRGRRHAAAAAAGWPRPGPGHDTDRPRGPGGRRARDRPAGPRHRAGGALKQALELAAQFGAMSRPALAAVLSCVDDAGELSLAEGMAREADRVTDLLDSPDGREGLAAFVAKRPARFS